MYINTHTHTLVLSFLVEYFLVEYLFWYLKVRFHIICLSFHGEKLEVTAKAEETQPSECQNNWLKLTKLNKELHKALYYELKATEGEWVVGRSSMWAWLQSLTQVVSTCLWQVEADREGIVTVMVNKCYLWDDSQSAEFTLGSLSVKIFVLDKKRYCLYWREKAYH